MMQIIQIMQIRDLRALKDLARQIRSDCLSDVCKRFVIVSIYPYPPPLCKSSRLSSVCKSTSKAVLSTMQLTLHATRQTPHGAVQAMSAWSVKTRHAPSRYCRDARVYDHSTTAMHEIEYMSPIEYTPPALQGVFRVFPSAPPRRRK